MRAATAALSIVLATRPFHSVRNSRTAVDPTVLAAVFPTVCSGAYDAVERQCAKENGLT
jgi:hypothetical protein